MVLIPGPYEIFDIEPSKTVDLHIVNFERGQVVIHPEYRPEEKIVDALRLHLAPGTKAVGLPYYDVTSKTLQAQLLGYLERPGYDRYVYRITKYGIPPRARFSLEVVPRAAVTPP